MKKRSELLDFFRLGAITIPILLSTACDRFMLYQLHGTLIDRDNDKPSPHHEIGIALSEPAGMFSLEPVMAQHSRTDGSMQIVTSRADGTFDAHFNGINSPLYPSFVFRLEGKCAKAWLVKNSADAPEVKVWNPLTEEFEPINTREVEPAPQSGGYDNPIQNEIELRWNDASSCSKADLENEKIVVTFPQERKNKLMTQYGGVFSQALGISYLRLFGSGFFGLEVPLGFRKGSFGFGLLGDVRIPMSKRIDVVVGIGPELLHVRAEDEFSPPLLISLSGVYFFLHAGMSFTLRNGIYGEIGYGSTTVAQETHDSRPYFQLGFSF